MVHPLGESRGSRPHPGPYVQPPFPSGRPLFLNPNVGPHQLHVLIRVTHLSLEEDAVALANAHEAGPSRQGEGQGDGPAALSLQV